MFLLGMPQLLLGMRQPFSEFAATDAGQDFTCALSSAANMPFCQVETVDPRDLPHAARPGAVVKKAREQNVDNFDDLRAVEW